MEHNYFLKARPVFLKGCSTARNTFAVFRAELDSLQNTTIHLTAASFYRLTVNGIFVCFGPARAAEGYARIDMISLDPYARQGKNEILIEVAGYFCKSLSTVHQPSFVCAEIRNGQSILAATGFDFTGYEPSCKVQKAGRYSKQRHFTEIWDFRGTPSLTEEKDRSDIEVLELPLVMLERKAPYPLYQDITWKQTKCNGTYIFDETLPYRKERFSRGNLPCGWEFWPYNEIELHPYAWLQRQKQTICASGNALPLTLKQGEYAILDLTHIEVGFLKTDLEAHKESELILAFTEHYEGDIFTFPNMNVHNVLDYFLDEGDRREVMSFEPYSCRYVMLAVKSGEITLHSFGVKTFMFDIRHITYPNFEDDALNSIYRAAVRTFAHNAVDIYMDCPSRERAGWLCDSYFMGKTEYALTGKTEVEDAFLENYRLFKGTPDLPQGMLPMCYPSDIIPLSEKEDSRFIPQWAMWYILEAADYISNRGHEEQKEAFRPGIYGLLDFFSQYENEDGLLEGLPSWNFVEWSIANDWTQDVSYPTNFLYAGVLEAVASIYGDKTCLRRAEEVRKETIRQSFNGTYFHDHAIRGENGKLIRQEHTSEACQYYAVLFGDPNMDSETYQPLKKLITDVFSPDRNGMMPEIFEINAFIGVYLRLETLLKLGEYELLLRDIKDFFGDMEKHTGTLWENRDVKGSLDHGFASYALAAIQKAMAASRGK